MTLQQLGETIRLRRVELGLTQEELAEKAGINSQTVGTIENGYKGPRYDTLTMVTEALGLEVKVERRRG